MVLREFTDAPWGNSAKMSDPALQGMKSNLGGSGQGGDGLRRSSWPNQGIPPERLGAASFPTGLLSSTYLMAGGGRMTRTTFVAPPDAFIRKWVEDDAGYQSSAATSEYSIPLNSVHLHRRCATEY